MPGSRKMHVKKTSLKVSQISLMAFLMALAFMPRPSMAETEPTFFGCDTDQQETLRVALEEAQTMAAFAFDALALTPADRRNVSVRFETWFGGYNSEKYNIATVEMHNIKHTLQNDTYDFECGCDFVGAFSITTQDEPGYVQICSGFFSVLNEYEQAAQLIRETSRWVAGTSYISNGLYVENPRLIHDPEASRYLAYHYPELTTDNADSYRFFALNYDWSAMGFEYNETLDLFGWSLAVGDLNNDSHPDIAVGAPGDNDSTGRVFIFKGTHDLDGNYVPAEADMVTSYYLSSEEAGDEFGTALAIGDFNGDSSDDLAVGAPGKRIGGDSDSGAVFVYNALNGDGNSGYGLRPSQFITQGPTGLGSDDPNDRFGSALVVGNFNGDIYDDLAIGVPGENLGQGRVYVFLGSEDGLQPDQVIGQSGLGADENGDEFGYALAAGDFDFDGYDDLAVGAPSENSGQGRVFIYRGSIFGFSPWRLLGQSGLDTDEPNDFFGQALTTGDLNNDGHDDLAVGAPGENGYEGRVYTFRYDTRSRIFLGWETISQAGLGTNEDDDLFGSSLTIGHFNGDAIADLVVGARGENNSTGIVFAFSGSETGLDPISTVDQTGLGSNEPSDLFGFSMASGDYSAGSILVISAPYERYGHPRCGYSFVYNAETLTPIVGIDQQIL